MKKTLIILFAFSFVLSTMAQKNSKDNDILIFKDKIATELSSKASNRKISKMSNPELKALAEALKDGSYSTDYRVATFEAMLHPDELGNQLQIGNGYSRYEGITGIYLEEGEQTILVDGIEEGSDVKLVVPDWNRRAPEGIKPTEDPLGWGIIKDEYEIANGVNVIDVKKSGLVYVWYYSKTPETEKPISFHFVGDKINGYFDLAKGDTDEDWDNLLDNAVYPVIDARGRHAQIAYPVEACNEYARSRGVELLSNYDSLVFRQHRFIGLEKYNKVPKNHILARVNYNYYMFRDGDGVAYMGAEPGYAMAMVVDPSRVVTGDPCWGFSHEVGHVHQLRPYLNWGGLGEVSNNITTMYVTRSFGVDSRLQRYYETARESIVEGGISFLRDKDVFHRLVPFWQLHLYFVSQGRNDFYADLYEVFRNSELSSGGNDWGKARGKDVALYQLNFVKEACMVGKTDFTEFFEKWGFLAVDEFEVNDYGKYNYKMTQEMVDKCKAEIAAMNLPKPVIDPIMLEDVME